MSEHDLELLITLDDPVEAPPEDIFHHLQSTNLDYWLSRPFSASQFEQREAISDDRN
jgi:hypothetical protein